MKASHLRNITLDLMPSEISHIILLAICKHIWSISQILNNGPTFWLIVICFELVARVEIELVFFLHAFSKFWKEKGKSIRSKKNTYMHTHTQRRCCIISLLSYITLYFSLSHSHSSLSHIYFWQHLSMALCYISCFLLNFCYYFSLYICIIIHIFLVGETLLNTHPTSHLFFNL